MRKTRNLVACTLAMMISLSGAAAPGEPATPDSLTPLTPEQHDIVWNMTGDPEPEVRDAFKKENQGQHFLTCDELNLHLFEPALRNAGGAYVGVGTDQAYIFMGWARPELGWMIDYDPLVIQIHGLYRIFFIAADTPEKFKHFWTDEGAAEARQVIRDQLSFGPARESALALFAQHRALVNRRLNQSINLMRKSGTRFYLNDQDDYAHVRAMIMTGRARAQQANLLGNNGINEIGNASRTMGVPIRTLYLSNVEDYWSYGSAYVANLRTLNFDESTVILRTVASKHSNGDYRYVLQKGLNLLKWLDSGQVKRIRDMFPRGAVRDREQVQLITIEHEPRTVGQ